MPVDTLPGHAQAVVIGAGIAGCSVAYHLAELGWRDIVVLDQGELFETGGSTSHAPGLVFQVNPSRTMTRFAAYTVDLWSRLELDGAPCARAVGSLEVAWTPERLADLRRKAGLALSWGVEARVLSPAETRDLLPMVSGRILGSLHVPSDVHTRAVRPAEAMARSAERRGARFYGNVEVTGFGIANGRITAVHTTGGDMETELVVSAVGIWAPRLCALAGVPIPLAPMQHIYAVTTPLPELRGAADEISMPFLRHQDRSMYFRQEGEAIGIGSYRHEPLLVESEQIPRYGRDCTAPAEMPFTPGHFEAAMTAAREVIPGLSGAGLTRGFNGLFSFTVDGFPVLGESPQVRGLWSAQAVWITHAAGVGRAVAEWITDGEPSVDLRECDIARFHPHALGRPYVRARASRQYREVYDIVHPLQQADEPRDIRLTPFYERQKQLGAAFFEDAGWERPRWYGANRSLLDSVTAAGRSRTGWAGRQWSPAVAAEHAATRERVALFDLTPFAKFELTGPGALGALQRLATNQMDRPVGSITYTPMLTPGGGIKCDLTVTRLAPERFLVVTGGTMGLHDLEWIRSHLPGDRSVSLTDVSSDLCCVGLWGPRARDLLSAATEDDLGSDGFPYLTARDIAIGDVRATALRISYVGELGWEIYAPADQGLRLWDTLWGAGGPLGLIAAGGGAFDSLRLEKGYRLWGSDIHTEYNPFEAGTGFAVKMGKGEFIGRDALGESLRRGLTRRLTCMTLDDPRSVIVGSEPILDGDRVLGYVTSANYGHSVGRGIAYGYLPPAYAEAGKEVEILYFGDRHRATVANEPLFDPRGRRMRA